MHLIPIAPSSTVSGCSDSTVSGAKPSGKDRAQMTPSHVKVCYADDTVYYIQVQIVHICLPPLSVCAYNNWSSPTIIETFNPPHISDALRTVRKDLTATFTKRACIVT